MAARRAARGHIRRQLRYFPVARIRWEFRHFCGIAKKNTQQSSYGGWNGFSADALGGNADLGAELCLLIFLIRAIDVRIVLANYAWKQRSASSGHYPSQVRDGHTMMRTRGAEQVFSGVSSVARPALRALAFRGRWARSPSTTASIGCGKPTKVEPLLPLKSRTFAQSRTFSGQMPVRLGYRRGAGRPRVSLTPSKSCRRGERAYETIRL